MASKKRKIEMSMYNVHKTKSLGLASKERRVGTGARWFVATRGPARTLFFSFIEQRLALMKEIRNDQPTESSCAVVTAKEAARPRPRPAGPSSQAAN